MKTNLVIALALTASLGACASNVRIVDIDSKPSGAVIYVNGEKKGVTRSQVKIEIESGQRVLIQLAKPRQTPVFQYWRIEEIPEKKLFTMEPE